MKRFKNFTKTVAVALAMLVFLSGFSVLASAVDYEKVTVSADDYLKDESGETATPDTANVRKKGVYSTGAGKDTYHMYANASYGLRIKGGFTFTNQIDGKKITYPTNWGACEYEYAKNDSTGKTTAVWCIQPGVAINGAKYWANEDANTTYWKQLNKKTDIRDAIAATIAFGKYKGATQNNAYYFAVQFLVWDYITGFRNPVTYKETSKNTSLINRVYSNSNTKKVNDVKDAMKEIIGYMKKMNSPIPEVIKDNGQVYETITKAQAQQKADNPNDKKVIKLNDPNAKGEYKGSVTVQKLAGYSDVTYKIVNENGNNPNADKNFTVSYKNKKFSVSTTANLKTLADKGHYYYIKIERKVSNYTKSAEDNIYQNAEGNVQTMLNSLEFSVPEQTAYIPLFYEHKEELGSLFIEKDITTNISGVDYNDDYSGWYFSATNQTTNKTTVLKTNSSGSTEYIEDITLGTKFKIKELGRLISSTDNESDFSKVTTVSGKKYGFPQGFTDVTGGGQEKTYTVSSSTEAVKVEWENKAELKFPVKLTKDTDDGGPIKGYYFLVYDFASSNRLIENPTIVGPTDMNGDISFTLDRVVSGHTIHVVELGRLKTGQSSSFERVLTRDEIKTGAFRDRFAIPSQYKEIAVDSQIAVTGLTDTIPIPISQKNIQDFYDDPYNYEKEYTITNTTEGYIAITKTDSVTKEPIGNVTFNIYASGMNDSEGDDITADPVATIVTDENGYGISELLPTGTYYIVEADCPATYHRDTKKHYVEIRPGSNKVSTATQYWPENTPTTVVIDKRESSSLGSNNIPIAGCDLQIFEKPASGSVNYSSIPVYQFTTTKSPENIVGKLELGKTYILHEKSCPVGFCLADDVEFTVKNTPGTPTTVTMLDTTTKVSVAKLDVKTQKYMAGATLQIQDSNNKPVKVKNYNGTLAESWVSQTTPLMIEKTLEAGKKYTLVELNTVDGYTTAKPVSFTVETDGKVQTVEMYNHPVKVEVHKKDTSTQNYLENAVLQIQDSNGNAVKVPDYDGNLVDKWTTRKTPLTIEGYLKIGQTYKLIELKNPVGYTLAAPVTFKVSDTNETQVVTMYDSPIQVEVSKQAITGSNELEGCKLQITEKGSSTVIVSWTSTNTPKVIKGVLEVGKTYVLTETKPCDGYTTAESVEFTIANNGEIQKVTMKDAPTEITFNKLDTSKKNHIANAVLQIQDENGKVVKVKDFDGKLVEKWTTKTTPLTVRGILIVGKTYKLVELSSPDGYSVAEPVVFTVKDTTEHQSVTMYDDTTKIKLSKKEITGSKEIPGCKLQLTEKGKTTVIDSWTSSNTPYYIEGKLVVGKTYVLTETSPADGFVTAESIEFTVLNGDAVQTVTMKDDTTKISFEKIDTSNSKNMAGAVLQIQDLSGNIVKVTDFDGNLVEKWTTRTNPLTVEGILAVGKTYKLLELENPKGYTKANPVTFTVNDTKEIQSVKIYDSPTKVKVSKTDITGKNEIPGCELEITEKGKTEVIKKWTSTSTPYYIEGVLEVGKTYVLTERKPADGFVTAESIEFTIQNSGEIQTVVMKDEMTTLGFTKTDITGTKEVPGCKLQVTEKGSTDIIDTWTSTSTAHYIIGKLAVGKTYVLTETYPADGYVTAQSVEFIVRDTGIVQNVTMKDEKTKIKIIKQAADTKENLADCVLAIYDSDNKEIKRFTTTNEPIVIEGELIVGKTYTLKEISAADGYMKSAPVQFTVKDTPEVQTVTMVDKKYPFPDLPKTGGNGLLPFLGISGIFFTTAAFVFFSRKRKNTNKDN